ncbi:MAG: DUF4215 domain-containing protein, partial [Candidatus Binatia bacterium]
FPGVTAGSADSTFAGESEALVAKLGPSLNMLLAATFLGGSGGGLLDAETAHALTLDGAGNLYVAGQTPSADFPVAADSADPTFAFTAEAFVAMLDAELSSGCGNEQLEIGEECDDGNTTSLDGCSASCQEEVCGDGVTQRELGEECDDGNTVDGDGCSASCQVEVCGNERVDIGEECDDGNTINGDGCSASCQEEPSLLETLKGLINSCGICSPAVRTLLLTQIDLVMQLVEQGNLQGALNTLQVLVRNTELLIRLRLLPAVEGRRLIVAMEEVIAELSAPR